MFSWILASLIIYITQTSKAWNFFSLNNFYSSPFLSQYQAISELVFAAYWLATYYAIATTIAS